MFKWVHRGRVVIGAPMASKAENRFHLRKRNNASCNPYNGDQLLSLRCSRIDKVALSAFSSNDQNGDLRIVMYDTIRNASQYGSAEKASSVRAHYDEIYVSLFRFPNNLH